MPEKTTTMSGSRTDLLAWLNDLLQINYTKIEQCGSGAAYCQILDSIYGDIPMSRVRMNAKHKYEYIANFEVMQNVFKAKKIDKPIPVKKLVKCRMQDNLEFLQWMKRFWDANHGGQGYDATARREGAPIEASATIASFATDASSELVDTSPLRRFVVIAAIQMLKRFRPRQGYVLFLTDKLCVKYGTLKPLSEASTLRFVAKYTSIPVPKVYCAFVHNGWTYIVMERIKGDPLVRVWLSLSVDSKRKILTQLNNIVKEMRRLPAPGPGVANVDGGPLYDGRLPGTSLTLGPFRTIEDFHSFLRGGHQAHPDHYPEVSRMIALQDRPWPLPVFTHGDLSSLNILVRCDEVVGIVDWETAGWYPSYWEYTTACQVNPRNYFWQEEIDKFLEPMPQEWEMEKIRLKYFGDV